MPLRKVYFYRAFVGIENDGSPTKYFLREPLRYIDSLAFTPVGRYQEIEADELLCSWVDRDRAPQRFRLGRIRRADLPQVERAGKLQNLRIAQDSGLVEQAFFAYFANNVLGMLFNFYGPRASSLASYIREKHPGAARELKFEPLIRQDVLEQLDKFDQIRLLDLNVRRSFIDSIRQANQSLADALEAATRVGEARQIEVVLRPERYTRDWLGGGVKETIKRIARLSGFREETHKLQVRGRNTETNQLETLDLLHDQLVTTKEVDTVSFRSRAIDKNSAYRAIEASYRELRDELEQAASLF